MRVRVVFRVNRNTGEVEAFEVVEAAGAASASAAASTRGSGGDGDDDEEHDWIHEGIAHALGSVLEPAPDVREVLPGRAGGDGREAAPQTPEESDRSGRSGRLELDQ